MNDQANRPQPPLDQRAQMSEADVIMGRRILLTTVIVGGLLLIALALPRIREIF